MSVLRSPALHMLALGGLLFCAVVAANGGLPVDRPVLEVPRSRVGGMVDMFRQDHGRSPTVREFETLVDELIDQEVLLRYALELGLQDDPVVQRRLAQIAQFVDSEPNAPITIQDGATRAMDLGLHESDVVVRRMLADGARRLIRSVVLTREPSAQALETFRVEHAALFTRPPTVQITHVMVNALAHGEGAETKAELLLERIRSEQILPAEAVGLGDEAFVPGQLPPLTDTDLERHFGSRFVKALTNVEENSWAGPLRSRYGYHAVYMHARRDAYLPPLSEIKDEVQQRFLQDVADRWLDYRLRQLRAGYEVFVPDIAS